MRRFSRPAVRAAKLMGFPRSRGFTMVELLTVIVIISILLTLATVGLGNMGGNPVTAGVATAESVFDEARSTAVGKGVRAGVLVSKNLTNNPANNRRQLFVVTEETDKSTGQPTPSNKSATADEDITWELTSRGVNLPDGVYFSEKFSVIPSGGTTVKEIPSARIKDAKQPFIGNYYLYVFGPEGIPSNPGVSFVIGRGARVLTGDAAPKVTSSAKRDFGGFAIWRNGSLYSFSGPDEMAKYCDGSIPAPGGEF